MSTRQLEIRGVQFSYKSVPVLKNINLSLDEGEVLSLVGPNGSGKTTLLKCINKILKPEKGTILVKGKNVRRMRLKELACFFGYVPQSTYNSLPLTVFDTVLLGRTPYMNFKTSERDKEMVFEVLELMGIEEMAFKMFNELSGGERQRVLIARSLAQEPHVLLLDEPTSNLDLKYQLEMLHLIVDMVKEKGISTVMAIHDLNLASRFSDKIVMLKNGRVCTTGAPWEILTSVNIKEVYGVEATIIDNNSRRPYIIPLFSKEKDHEMKVISKRGYEEVKL